MEHHRTTGPDQNPPDKKLSELNGYLGLHMKKEVLRIARACFTSAKPQPELFCACLGAPLGMARHPGRWRVVVEAAYQKLSTQGKRQARPWMLSFYWGLRDFHAAERFIPGRYTTPVSSMEMACAVETKLALGKIEQARTVVRRATKVIRTLENPSRRAHIISTIADYCFQTGEWDKAIRLWEPLKTDPLMAESATFGLIGLHLERALLTIQSGRAALAYLRQHPDPELDRILPGNCDSRWRDTEAKLAQIERILLRAQKTTTGPAWSD
jgi:hypothetical protein